MMKTGKDTILIDSKKPDTPKGQKEGKKKRQENIRYQPMTPDCLLVKHES